PPGILAPEEVPLSNEITLTIVNEVGLHARPAALFVQTAGGFQSAITVCNLTRDTPAVDAKSMFSVLSLGAQLNHRIAIAAEGPDAEEALATISELVESGFGEVEGAPIPTVAPGPQLERAPAREVVTPRPRVGEAELKPIILPAKGGEMRELQG
ncbi:unnamed protein product, partial [marine sediment metagenome]